MPADLSPFEWLSNHLQLVGWPTLIALSWKAWRFLTKAELRFIASETHIKKMATNEFPHMQASLESIDRNIQKLVDKKD
jgi:hypothetical protein